MSVHIYTYLWLSPAEYNMPGVRKKLDDAGFDFEFADNSEPDDEGSITLYCAEHDSFKDLEYLASLEIPFMASYDPRLQGDGDRCRFVAFKGEYVFIQEDGTGCPVVPVEASGKLNPELLANGRRYWKYVKQVKKAWLTAHDKQYTEGHV